MKLHHYLTAVIVLCLAGFASAQCPYTMPPIDCPEVDDCGAGGFRIVGCEDDACAALKAAMSAVVAQANALCAAGEPQGQIDAWIAWAQDDAYQDYYEAMDECCVWILLDQGPPLLEPAQGGGSTEGLTGPGYQTFCDPANNSRVFSPAKPARLSGGNGFLVAEDVPAPNTYILMRSDNQQTPPFGWGGGMLCLTPPMERVAAGYAPSTLAISLELGEGPVTGFYQLAFRDCFRSEGANCGHVNLSNGVQVP